MGKKGIEPSVRKETKKKCQGCRNRGRGSHVADGVLRSNFMQFRGTIVSVVCLKFVVERKLRTRPCKILCFSRDHFQRYSPDPQAAASCIEQCDDFELLLVVPEEFEVR